MARGGHQLPLRVEEGLEARCHVVERAAEIGELARPGHGGAHAEVACRHERRRVAETVDAGGDRAAEDEAGGDGGGRSRGGDGEDLDVVAHVEHDPARQQHDGERQQDGEQRQAGQLQADGWEEAQGDRGGEPDRERGERDDEGELDHGTNR